MNVLCVVGGMVVLILFLVWLKGRKTRLRRTYLLSKYGKIRESAVGTSMPVRNKGN